MNSAAVHSQGLPVLSQSDLPPISTDEIQSSQMDSMVPISQNATFPKLNEIRRPLAPTNETKVIYHLEDKDCPTVIKIPICPDAITLRDLKTFLSLPKSHFKFYFKSFDKDVGVVKEQIFDDNSLLPLYQGKVVAFIESTESANSQCPSEISNRISRSDGMNDHLSNKRMGFHSDSTFISGTDTCGDTSTETDSMLSSRRGGSYMSPRHRNYNCKSSQHGRYRKCTNRHHRGHYGDSSVVTSDMESYVDSDDDYDEDFVEDDMDSDDDYEDYSSRISSTTEETSVSRQYVRRHRPRRSNRNQNYRHQNMSRTSSISSFSETSLSMNVININLNLDVVNYLGISLVGQTSQKGDGGIYVSSIMKGGAVDLDGRIDPGDMILQVNDINFDMLTNDEAVQVIREAVKKPGPIKLLVAKCWDHNPKGYFTIPRSEPVRPIDPGAWVAHTEAARAKYTSHDSSLPMNSSISNYGSNSLPDPDRQIFQQPQVPIPPVSTFVHPANAYPLSNSNSSSLTYPTPLMTGSPLRNSFKSGHSVTISSNPAATIQIPPQLTIDSDLETIACAMARPDSGLDVRDRTWLKIRIADAFIGSEVVQWLQSYVQRLQDRKEAKKLAFKLLKGGLIEHTVNLKNSFSEKCYYVFSELVKHKALNATTQFNTANQAGASQLDLEERFSNGLRLPNENFPTDNATGDQSNFASTNQFNLTTNSHPHAAGAGLNQPKPELYMMPFMRYWDETSEIHNYGLFGPQQGNSDLINNSALNDGVSSNHSGANCGAESYQSDEQLSQRSGQSVLYNPNAAQNINATNTMASNGSNGSRHTNASNPQSNGNSNHSTNSTNGNILNHHYEDLQVNPTTGNLVPTSSLTNEEITEYRQQKFVSNSHVFAQVYRTNGSDDSAKGDTKDMNSLHQDYSGTNQTSGNLEGIKQVSSSHVYLSGDCDLYQAMPSE